MHTPTSYNKLLGAVKYTQNSKFSFKLLGGGRYGERQTGLKFFKSKVVQNISQDLCHTAKAYVIL